MTTPSNPGDLDARAAALADAVRAAFAGIDTGSVDCGKLAAALAAALPDWRAAARTVGATLGEHHMLGQWFIAEEHYIVAGTDQPRGWSQIDGPVRLIDARGNDCGTFASWRDIGEALDAHQDALAESVSRSWWDDLPVAELRDGQWTIDLSS